MKTKGLLAGILSLFIFAGFISCSDDDDDNKIDDIVKNTLATMFPDAKNVKWEDNKGLKVAEFMYEGFEKEVWFNVLGQWLMTKTELDKLENTPEAVQTAHKAGKYADWKIDDVDKLEREEPKATYYVIEVEKGKEEIDLYYLTDGTLVKEIADNEENEYFAVIPENIKNEILKNHPKAVFTDIDVEYNYEIEARVIEIEYKSEGVEYESQYTIDGKYTWVKTDKEMDWSKLDDTVKNAFIEKYPGKKADDVIFSSRADVNYFIIEIDDVEPDVYAFFDHEGKFVKELNKYN